MSLYKSLIIKPQISHRIPGRSWIRSSNRLETNMFFEAHLSDIFAEFEFETYALM
jgi:hypothetical protein